MTKLKFLCNNAMYEVDANPASTLLDFIRDDLKLTGTKEGCREGDCGACTVLLGRLSGDRLLYKSVNSCLTPLHAAGGAHLVTIEGLSSKNISLIQQSFIDEGAVQCGFCTPGFIISLTGYLLGTGNPDIEDMKDSAAGNLCRCTGHVSIVRSIKSVLDKVEHSLADDRIDSLISLNVIPAYFASVKDQLRLISDGEIIDNEPAAESYIISGGTDLYVQKGREIAAAAENRFIKRASSDPVYLENNFCFIEAATTVEEISKSEIINSIIPGIRQYLKLFGSLPIRNRATIGGNIVNASPIGDITNIFLPLSAELILSSAGTSRVVKLSSFFKDYKIIDLKPGEILTKIYFPVPAAPYKINYEKVSKREHLDIASVNSTIFIRTDCGIIIDVKISSGGTAPVPLLLNSTSDFLLNKKICPDIITEAARIAAMEISPISDIRGSARYKRLLLNRLIKAHFISLFPEVFEEVVI